MRGILWSESPNHLFPGCIFTMTDHYWASFIGGEFLKTNVYVLAHRLDGSTVVREVKTLAVAQPFWIDLVGGKWLLAELLERQAGSLTGRI